MSAKENEALIRRYYELANDHPLSESEAKEFFAPGCVEHAPGKEGQRGGHHFMDELRGAIPDAKITVGHVASVGDEVTARWHVEGTPHGTILGATPPSKPMALSGMAVWKIKEGKCVEEWEYLDRRSLEARKAPQVESV